MTNLIGQSLGRYHILEQLGEGGMATVYKAYDTRLEREVALKVIKLGAFPPDHVGKMLKRFEREARALARLSHPNIIKVIEYGRHERQPYLVMAYLPGTLKAQLGQPVPWAKACKLLIPIAQALDYAHHQGLIHRDVKPSNILLSETSQPMLADFGIAKILETEESTALTGTGMGVGTPEYMAPEQWTGETVTQSDQYSLGVILYEMLTGRKPYTGNTPAAILLKQATESIPRPRRFAPDVPEALEKTLARTLDRKPENRYPDLATFAAALEDILPVSLPLQLPPEPALRPKQDPDATIDLHGTLMPAPKISVAPPSTTLQSRQKTAQRSVTGDWLAQIPSSWLVRLGVSGLFLSVITMGVIGIIFLKNGALAASPALVASPSSAQIATTANLVSPGLVTPRSTTRKAPTVTAIPRSTQAPSITPLPSNTPQPSLTPISVLSVVPSSTRAQVLTPGVSRIREADGMLMLPVPEGSFSMGSSYDSREAPVHKVTLDAFWIDETEITNALYAKCVNASQCQAPKSSSSETRKNYYDDPQYADFPVIFVDWTMAKTYCEWAGARLPTSAEWEKAARGTDGRLYPWGNTLDKTRANFGGKDTLAVRSYEKGKSPYGLYDLAGNVWEWVSDWCDDGTYYSHSPEHNPLGPESGACKIIRGASWGNISSFTRSTSLQGAPPSYSSNLIGFRCVVGVNP